METEMLDNEVKTGATSFQRGERFRFFQGSTLLLLASVLSGCVSTGQKETNLSRVDLLLAPDVRMNVDPSFDAATMKTFAVVPASAIKTGVAADDIAEQQELFQLRNALEAMGYHFVPDASQASMIATIEASIQYREQDVPPSLSSYPVFVPGSTFQSVSQVQNQYGRWQGTVTTTTTTPGEWQTRTTVIPGYRVGTYYPCINVAAVAASNKKLLWNGTGVGSSMNGDVRVSGQLVLLHLMGKLPPCPDGLIRPPNAPPPIGVALAILSNDGNNYYPTVTKVEPGSQAEKVGLEFADMVLSVGSESTRNLSRSEFDRVFWARSHPAVIRVRRLGQSVDVSVE